MGLIFNTKRDAEIDRINAETKALMKKEGLCLMCSGSGRVWRGSVYSDICPNCGGTGKDTNDKEK